jgi:type I restriction enzyme M protein
MLTDPKLRSAIDQLWDKLWEGGLNNPMDSIEQLSYLIFLKRLDEAENQREHMANKQGKVYVSAVPKEMRWSEWRHRKADDQLKYVRETVFPSLKKVGQQGSSFERYMENAEFKINKASLLVEVCKTIDDMEISAYNQDVQGDLYEYLLSRLSIAGRNGQFRTPRHIIRMMIQMMDPKPRERIGDLAAGTCGFLVNAYQYILEKHTATETLTYDEEGFPHNLIGDLLKTDEREFLQKRALRGFDNDSGMTMLRIGSMNLMLHGVDSPQFFYTDTLSKAFTQAQEYDVILMNPPFKGAVDEDDVNDTLPKNTTKTELLFPHLVLRALDMGGRAAVIVPDGVLFGSSKAHVALRTKLVEENRLDGVISMPSGVFKPYAGVSTAVVFFTKGAKTERIWFYDMAHDGFSMDDKRQPTPDQNDIPDILDCWRNRHNKEFQEKREQRLKELEGHVAPLKTKRLKIQGEIHRLTFEAATAADEDYEPRKILDADQVVLTQLEKQIEPLQTEIEQLNRQFWVDKKQIKDKKYDLSASRYRQTQADEQFYESPRITYERLLKLEQLMINEIQGS